MQYKTNGAFGDFVKDYKRSLVLLPVEENGMVIPKDVLFPVNGHLEILSDSVKKWKIYFPDEDMPKFGKIVKDLALSREAAPKYLKSDNKESVKYGINILKVYEESGVPGFDDLLSETNMEKIYSHIVDAKSGESALKKMGMIKRPLSKETATSDEMMISNDDNSFKITAYMYDPSNRGDEKPKNTAPYSYVSRII